MIEIPAFFSGYRKTFGRIKQKQIQPIEKLIAMMDADQRIVGRKEYWAYMLATVKHETADTFLPVKEAYWMTEKWREKHLRYHPWYGRGYVQLTWETNYAMAKRVLGVDFLADPDLVMVPEHAYEIMVQGMLDGWFTGKCLGDYLGSRTAQANPFKAYTKCRRIINGRDRDNEIAGLAMNFEKVLTLGGMR